MYVNPIRKKTVAGETQVYEFDQEVTHFLVLNTSGGDVVVSFDQDGNGNSWIVPDGAWRRIPGYETENRQKTVYVTAKATSATDSGVEIEAIRYCLSRR